MLSPAAAMRLLRAHTRNARPRRQRRFALDVSNQNPATSAQIKASRAAVLICKATQAADFRDATLSTHRRIAATLKIPFGSYLFLDPTVDGGKQAAFYLAYAKPRSGDVQPIIDAESIARGETFEQVADVVEACARSLEGRGYRPLLYGSTSFLQQLYAARPALRLLDVWQAQYPGLFARWLPRLAALRTRLRHDVTVVMWQWTDSYSVGGRGFDCSLLLAPTGRLLIP